MNYERVQLTSLGVHMAPVVVTTDELEDALAPVYRAVGLVPGHLEAMTGIVERRWWEPNPVYSELAATAAIRALERSEWRATDIDMLVYGGVCREDFEPATACHVAAALDRAGHRLPGHAILHDISAACLGVMSGIIDVANRIELGQISAGLVVSCESAREINELTLAALRDDPTMARLTRSIATFTGGSGAVAVLVTNRTRQPGHRLLGGATCSAPAHHALCRWSLESHGDGVRPFAATDAAAVLEHGVALGAATWTRFSRLLGWAPEDLDRTVCHQVGRAHRETMMKTLGLPLEHDFVAYDYLGNTGSVALPSALALAESRRFVQPGHRVGLFGIGSGLTCSMLGVQW